MKKFKITFNGRQRGSQGAFSTLTYVMRGTDREHVEKWFFNESGETFETNCILSIEEIDSVKVKSILLKSGEGRPEWYPRTFGSFEAFESGMRDIQQAIMLDFGGKWSGGYYKMDVVVTWEDGETYTARYDLERPEKYASLQKHIRNHCRFHGGIWKPAHLTMSQYNHYLHEYATACNPVEYLAYLEKYDL